MLNGNVKEICPKFRQTVENDIVGRFPNIAKHIDSVRIEKGKKVPISGDLRRAGIFMSIDQNTCTKEANPQNTPAMRFEMQDSTRRYIDDEVNKYISLGYTEKNARAAVKDSLIPQFGYDAKTGQYVMSLSVKGMKDSLLERTSVPMWNIGFLQKIFRQPYATSFAKRLVSVESFSNAWADAVMLFKESFEGYGKLSSVARGNMEQNNSNPVTAEASTIVDEVFNLSVDFESDIMEDIKASQAGNFITPHVRADRERYAQMVLDRMQDALLYFGSKEAGITGLLDVAEVTDYTDPSLNSIFISQTETAKGSKIVQAMNKVISDFLRANHYMPREVKINVSEFVFQALTQTVYSDQYNPSSPLKILQGNFKGNSELDGGQISVGYTITPDPMLNPSVTGGEQNPYNPNPYDFMIITVPRLEDAMGTQDSLIIHPELLKSYIVPALWQRSGMLYTMYKRIGGVIAPIEGTVHAIRGFGYRE